MASVSSSPSRSSASSSQERGQPSPIPYYELPLEYEPGIECLCRRKAARWISWSDNNPGRRYLKCEHAREGGCNFYRWFDPASASFLRQLLVNLRDRVRSLCTENMKLRGALSDAKAGLEKGMVVQRAELRSIKEASVQKDELIR